MTNMHYELNYHNFVKKLSAFTFVSGLKVHVFCTVNALPRKCMQIVRRENTTVAFPTGVGDAQQGEKGIIRSSHRSRRGRLLVSMKS
jgi:hypothetical protein